ncbi:MAG: anthranilate synthase component I [Pseudomonadota bacterium]
MHSTIQELSADQGMSADAIASQNAAMADNHPLQTHEIPRSAEEFAAVAKRLRESGFTHLPLVRETLADLDTPLSCYLKLADQPYSYLLESVQGGEKWDRYSIIGLPCDTVHSYRAKSYQCRIDGTFGAAEKITDPLAHIRSLQAKYKVATYPGLPEMIGGLVGYFGYETIALMESKLDLESKPDAIDAPDILLMVSLDVLVFDNLSGRIFVVTLLSLDEEGAFESGQAKLDNLLLTLNQSFASPSVEAQSSPISEDDYRPDFDQESFHQAVDKCRDYIRDGDIMQVVLSQRLSAPFSGRSIDLYRALRTINPSPHMYFMNMGEFEIVGSSPEILVQLFDGKVTVRPIAGTRMRGKDEAQDLAMEEELINDQKELAEHLMLIDLGRNDVGRIARTGSVQLTEQMSIERYSHVMHIVSNVEGQVQNDLDAIDVLKATFPAGTVSGAPKIRAMEIIHELEPTKRGVYSGAVGYLSWNGNMDTAIAIRTAVVKEGTVYVQAGAGIVADSIPKYEWKETLNKARAMIKAVEMAESGLRFAQGGQ